MTSFDEFRILLIDGQSPFNNTAATPFRQPAFCILEKPFCAAVNYQIKKPTPINKPLKADQGSVISPKPSDKEQCDFDLSWFAVGKTKAGYMMDLSRVIDSAPVDNRPVAFTYTVPSHFKHGGGALYTTDTAGVYTVTVEAQYNGGRSCTQTFDVIFI